MTKKAEKALAFLKREKVRDAIWKALEEKVEGETPKETIRRVLNAGERVNGTHAGE